MYGINIIEYYRNYVLINYVHKYIKFRIIIHNFL